MRIAILGAGIAGLSTAHFLRGRVDRLDIFEASDRIGGLARSFSWHGFDCDIAPHRLFTTDISLQDELCMLVPMHRVRRRSRILLQDKWLRDPVNAAELLWKFFPGESIRIVGSYLNRKRTAERTFEDLVVSTYGEALNDLFFSPYSEKLFGIPAQEISPVWGQKKLRMGGLRDLFRRRSKLYFRTFLYPNRGGYGAIVERLGREVRTRISLGTRVTALTRPDNYRAHGYRVHADGKGGTNAAEYDVVISTLPAPLLAGMLGKELPLTYRKAVLTYLLLDRPQMTSNHWLYFADRHRMLNRVAEFKHFGGVTSNDRQTVVCCETTDLDSYSLEAVTDELVRTGLIAKSEVRDGLELHLERAYPVYDLAYERHTGLMRRLLEEYPGIFIVGRQATFAHRDVDEIYSDAKRIAEQAVAFVKTHSRPSV